jgi:sarcosine oxidase
MHRGGSVKEGRQGLDRREFLKRSGLGAGAVALAGGVNGLVSGCVAASNTGAPRVQPEGRGREIAVVGAGCFGVWTALRLQEAGARVTLVDLYGPGNSRSTSGDETRGIRTSYPGREIWTSWAHRAIQRWHAFDDEWAESMGGRVFFETGDLILRQEGDPFISGVREIWDQTGVPYEVLDMDEVRRRWPQIQADPMEAALFEPGAGVARARAACQRVAQLFLRQGGEIRIARAAPGSGAGGRLAELELDGGAGRFGADLFVFALGPWFPKAFPAVMGERIRIPMGHVFYLGTPPGDHRFAHPNLPSWNVPGVTGWASLPPDHRGFRIRTGGQAGEDPDTSVRWIPEEFLDRPRQVLETHFPALVDQPIVETRACHYESSSTRDWIIDRHPEWENVWLAGGGSAEGFKFGPVLGDLIAGRVLGDDGHPELADHFRLEPPEEMGQ